MNDHFTKVSRLMSSEISALMPLHEGVAVDVVGDFGLDAAVLQVSLHGKERVAVHLRVPVRAIHQAEYPSHLRDFPLAADEAHDVDAAVEHRYAGHQALYARSRAVDVEDGDDNGFGFCGAADKAGNGLVDGVALDADEDDVSFALVFFGGRCGDVQGVFALEVAVQAQPLCADGVEVLAAGNAGHVFARQCEEGGNRAAHASGSCD